MLRPACGSSAHRRARGTRARADGLGLESVNTAAFLLLMLARLGAPQRRGLRAARHWARACSPRSSWRRMRALAHAERGGAAASAAAAAEAAAAYDMNVCAPALRLVSLLRKGELPLA